MGTYRHLLMKEVLVRVAVAHSFCENSTGAGKAFSPANFLAGLPDEYIGQVAVPFLIDRTEISVRAQKRVDMSLES